MPPYFNFARDVVDRLAQDDRTGLVFVDEHGHRRDYLFSEISQHSGRYAGAMRTLGIAPQDAVLVCACNTAKCLFAMLGLERLGAVPVPAARGMTVQALRDLAETSGAKWLICDRARRSSAEVLRNAGSIEHFLLIGEEAAGWERLDRLAENSRGVQDVHTRDTDPACIVDGDTFDHAALEAAAESSNALLLAGRGDVVWCALPMGNARWFANAYLAPWSCGAATVLQDAPFEPVERLDLLRELDVSILLQSAGDYAAQTQTMEIAHFRAPRLHRCLCIDGTVDAAVAKRWLEAMQIPIEDAAGGITLTAPSTT